MHVTAAGRRGAREWRGACGVVSCRDAAARAGHGGPGGSAPRTPPTDTRMTVQKLLPLLALAALAACGGDDDDNGIGPGDPVRACNVGSIDVGGSRDFTLGAGFGCKTKDIWETSDSAYAASYTVNLTAGTAYSITAFDRNDGSTSDFDLTMALFGPGDDTTSFGWIAASDDQGGGASGYNSQIIIVPKVTGRYTIRVAGWDEAQVGPVRLSVRACNSGAQLTTAAAVNGTVPAGACTIDGTPFVVHQFQATAAAARTVVVHSTAFQPAVIVGGPGQDIWAEGDLDNLDPPPLDVAGGDDAIVSFTAPRTGTYTVIVASFSGESGAYSVQLLDTPAAAAGLDVEARGDLQLLNPEIRVLLPASTSGKAKTTR